MVKLEAGKYYKTRDGRKVGPMRHNASHDNYPFVCDIEPTPTCDIKVAIWERDGTNYKLRNLDIVSEWVNYSSCAAVQVDVQREEYGPVRHPAATSGAMREKLDTIPYDLMPFQEATDAYTRVAEFGARKYAPWNWSKGLSRVQIIGSLLRHTWAYLRGEERDSDSGLLHTDHILWNAVTLAHNVHWNLEDGRRVEPERDYKLDREAERV